MDYIVFEAIYGLRPFSSPSSPYLSVPGVSQVGPQPGSEAMCCQVRKGEVGKREGNVGEQLALPVGIRKGFKKEEIFEILLEVCIEACQMKMVVRLAKRW